MPLALPAFHAITGCDIVSAFHKNKKKTTWKTLKLRPQTVDALSALSEGNIEAARAPMFQFVMAIYSP